MRIVLSVLLVTGCGSSGGGGDDTVDHDAAVDSPKADAEGTDAPETTFTLTSPSLTEGGVFDAAFTCNGANTSPQLVWSNPPAGTLGFAVELVDKTFPLIHWVIYDIPGSATGLPAGVEKVYAPTNVSGAHQTLGYNNTTRGYLGPCPPDTHTYEFQVYALDVATLPGTSMSTTRMTADTAIKAHDLGSAILSGTYTPP